MKEFLRDLLFTSDRQEFFVLQDLNSGSILVCGKNFQTLYYMSDFLMDTVVHNINTGNYFNRKFVEGLIDAEDSYKFTAGGNGKMPVPIKKPDTSMKERSDLARYKHKILAEMYFVLELRRIRLSQKRSLAFQEMIYTAKASQAKEFLEKGCPEDRILDFIYVKQFGDYKKIPYKQAAEMIIMKHKMSESFLARTELLRLKSFNSLKKAQTKEEMNIVLKEFQEDAEYRQL
jgi:hypothetical protein